MFWSSLLGSTPDPTLGYATGFDQIPFRFTRWKRVADVTSNRTFGEERNSNFQISGSFQVVIKRNFWIPGMLVFSSKTPQESAPVGNLYSWRMFWKNRTLGFHTLADSPCICRAYSTKRKNWMRHFAISTAGFSEKSVLSVESAQLSTSEEAWKMPHGTRYVPVNWFLCTGVHVREFKLIPTHSESKMDSGNEMSKWNTYQKHLYIIWMSYLLISTKTYFFQPPYMKISTFLHSPLPWAFLGSLWLSLSLVFSGDGMGRWTMDDGGEN